MIDVSIIFVSYNTKELTLAAIDSVYTQTQNLSYEIFVVDNNSQDNSAQAISEKYPNIKVIKNEKNLGFGAANNIAIKQAQGKYVFFLNTDTLLLNNAIKILFDFLEKPENQKIGCCGGNLYDINGNKNASYGTFMTPIAKFVKTFKLRYFFPEVHEKMHSDKTNKFDETKQVEFIWGADLLIRKELLDKYGAFDEKFFLYYEEVELQKRLLNAGYSAFIVPEAKIMHIECASSKKRAEKKAIFLKSEYIFLRDCYCKNNLEKTGLKFLFLYSLFFKLFTGNKSYLKLYKYILADK